jgi:hypothetical protein
VIGPTDPVADATRGNAFGCAPATVRPHLSRDQDNISN